MYSRGLRGQGCSSGFRKEIKETQAEMQVCVIEHQEKPATVVSVQVSARQEWLHLFCFLCRLMTKFTFLVA